MCARRKEEIKMPIKDIEKLRIITTEKITKNKTVIKLLNDRGETIKLCGYLQWTIPYPHGKEECYRIYKNGSILKINAVIYNNSPELSYASVAEQPAYC